MMTEDKIIMGSPSEDAISFAAAPDHIVVIRVTGRGSFQNSMELRRLVDSFTQPNQHPPTHFIIDLEQCITMDSTFMGVLASIGLHQLKAITEKLPVLNVNPQNMRLLKTLGLTQFMDVRESATGQPHLRETAFKCVAQQNVTRTDRIAHMIQAHQELCDVDSQNNLRFESVLKYLHDSLDKEKD